MYEIILIQKMVKQNQKYILKLTKKVCKSKHENVTGIFLKRKKQNENMQEIDTKICLKKIKKITTIWKKLS